MPHSLIWVNKTACGDKLWTTPQHSSVLPQAIEKTYREYGFKFCIHHLKKDFNQFLHWKELQDRDMAIHKIAQNFLTICLEEVYW